ncbi:trace amine-associated receptor 7d-like [Oculina patagonica]
MVMVAVKTKRRLQTHPNVLLACLALTDLMVGLVVQPLHFTMTIFLLQGKRYEEFCELNLAFIISTAVCCVASLYHLTLVSAERYLALKHSFTHSTVVTKSRLMVSCAVAWIAAVLPLSFQLTPEIITLIYALVAASISSIVRFQVVVYLEARRHEKAILSQQVSTEAREKFMKKKKALKLTTIILAALFLSYCTSFISRVVLQFIVVGTPTDIKTVARFLIVLPLAFNSVVNPVIYVVRNKEFRVAFVELLLRKSSQEAKVVEERLFGSRDNAVNRNTRREEREQNAEGRNGDGVQVYDKQEDNNGVFVSGANGNGDTEH